MQPLDVSLLDSVIFVIKLYFLGADTMVSEKLRGVGSRILWVLLGQLSYIASMSSCSQTAEVV